MAQPTGQTALITGASSGLGSDYARLFAADGHDVVLVARRKSKLDELGNQLADEHGINTHVIVADLSDPAAAQAIYDQVSAKQLQIEYLVNNAGFGTNGSFTELDIQRELAMIAVNITALTHLTHLFLPAMVERGHGRILNIGSAAGFQGGPYMATYYATKAFVNHFSEGLAHEVESAGITVTVSCPGATETEFSDISGNGTTRLFKAGAMTSTDVASHGYRAMMNGKRMAIPGIKNKLSLQALRISPRNTVLAITSRLNRP